MLTLQTAIAFIGVSLLPGITPGPDNLFVQVQSASHGRRAGLLVVLGLCSGLVLHTTAIALGLAAVFAASETAFSVLKWVGAAYLATFGVVSYFAAGQRQRQRGSARAQR
jgi:threonine/homoserine/homoserine lactone efflux protein